MTVTRISTNWTWGQGQYLVMLCASLATACGGDDECEPDPCFGSTNIYMQPEDGWKVDGRYAVSYTADEEGGCTFTYEEKRFFYCGGNVEISSPTGLGVLLIGGLHEAVDLELDVDSATLFNEEVDTEATTANIGCGQECDQREAMVEF